MQNHINKLIEDHDKTLPLYIYNLEEYEGERLVSHVPIHRDDYISVTLSDGTRIDNKKVKKVWHLDETINVEKQILSAFLTLED